MTGKLLLRPAVAGDAGPLTRLAMRSKAYWGYTDAFMSACRTELTVRPDDIDAGGHRCIIAQLDGISAGFYKLAPLHDSRAELDMLFVEPDFIGRGIGRTLMEHATQTAVDLGFRTLVIQGDPHARRFYEAAGGKQVGERESGSIPGRYLPVFEIEL